MLKCYSNLPSKGPQDLEELLDYEDYFPENCADKISAENKTKKYCGRGEKKEKGRKKEREGSRYKTTKCKRSKTRDSPYLITENMVGLKLAEIRAAVTAAESNNRSIKGRQDFDFRKDAYNKLKEAQTRNKDSILARRRRCDLWDEEVYEPPKSAGFTLLNSKPDLDIDIGMYLLDWHLNNLNLTSYETIGHKGPLPGSRKRSGKPIDNVSYYSIAEPKRRLAEFPVEDDIGFLDIPIL